MPSKTATVKIDGQGRCTIPIEVREALAIDGQETYAEVEVHVDD